MSAARDYVQYFEDMLLEAELAQKFLKGVTFEKFIANPEKQRAVIRCIEVIGEAARNVPEDIRNQYPEIEWRDMTGMRDRLIHGYPSISYKMVWDTVKVDLPILERQLQAILKVI